MRQEKETTTDFNLLRHRLEVEQESLLAELKTTALIAEKRERGSYGEYGELATEIAEVEKGLILEKRIREQLTEVEHALEKFDQGTYGLCDNCGKSIEPARLEALPNASLCLKVQGSSGEKWNMSGAV